MTRRHAPDALPRRRARTRRWIIAVMLAPLLLSPPADVLAAALRAGGPTTRVEFAGAAAPAEVSRIRKHLSAVESRLRANPPLGLTAAQRKARARHLDVLAAYRKSGAFPHNHDFAGRRVPYFVDAHGTRCAMAFLIDASGAREVVSLVAKVANNATVIELGRLPRIGESLSAWLESAGLTLDEAQAIQPAYGEGLYNDGDDVTSGHAFTAALVGTACGASTALNLMGPRSRTAGIVTPVIGALAGIAGIAVGSTHWDDGGESSTLGTIEAGIGGVSLLAAVWGGLRESGRRRSGHVSSQGTSRPSPALSLSSSPGNLLAVRLRF